jgi:hypothetical protein
MPCSRNPDKPMKALLSPRPAMRLIYLCRILHSIDSFFFFFLKKKKKKTALAVKLHELLDTQVCFFLFIFIWIMGKKAEENGV